MTPPTAEAIPHPNVTGGWTLRDTLTPKGKPEGLYVSKASAEAAATARNKHRRQK
jgi:hypothetical protein